MKPIQRIAIFTGPEPRGSVIETIERLAESRPGADFLVLSGGLKISPKARLRNKWRRFKHAPASTVVEVALAFLRRLSPVRTRHKTSRDAPRPLALDDSRVVIRSFERIHSKEAIQTLEEFSPDLGVSVGAPILREPLFAAPRLGTINLHKSLLPNYRGMPPAFWELHDGAEETGASIHWIDRGLDTGRIVLQRSLPIPPYTTCRGLQFSLDELGAELLVEAVNRIEEDPSIGAKQGPANTPTRGQPPILVRWAVERRLAQRRRREPLLRRTIKSLVFGAYVYGYAPVRNLVESLRGRSPAVVLLYHRVSDSFLDTVTVGVEQFDRQVEILSRHYEVVSLETLLADRGKPRRRRQVVITFDDGYADNSLAALILRRRGLPATFFLATRIVDSDRPFPHDQKRLGYGVPALTWEQVGRMANWGFQFGNHTTLHVDLGTADPETAERSIRDAAGDLQAHLDSPRPGELLAYPYGGRENLTADLRARLPELGVDCCLSAFGGLNPPSFDPFDVKRQGVDANVFDLGFRAIVESWALRA